jgi:hypothetical protein
MTVTLSQAHWFFGCDDRTVVPISWLVESDDDPGHNPHPAHLQDDVEFFLQPPDPAFENSSRRPAELPCLLFEA